MAEIRALTGADRDSWQPLWRGYQAFYKVQIPDAVSDETWRRLLDPAEPMWAALAHTDGRAVGLVHWIRHRSCWTVGDYVYLQDLFVAPDARGKGVGRHLIEHVYAAARQAGCARVYWLTHETNRDAMILYDRVAERSGFVQYRKVL
jgi:GNAT superfamily N-acetyltransferase